MSSGVLGGAPLSFPSAGVGVIEAASLESFYQDNPGADGSGTYAESFPIPRDYGVLKLKGLQFRVDFPYAAGESSNLRLYRYRKTGEFGAFTYLQITDSFIMDASRDWSWTYFRPDLIRPGFDLNPETDSIAVSNVYVAGGAPTGRALRVDFWMQKN